MIKHKSISIIFLPILIGVCLYMYYSVNAEESFFSKLISHKWNLVELIVPEDLEVDEYYGYIWKDEDNNTRIPANILTLEEQYIFEENGNVTYSKVSGWDVSQDKFTYLLDGDEITIFDNEYDEVMHLKIADDGNKLLLELDGGILKCFEEKKRQNANISEYGNIPSVRIVDMSTIYGEWQFLGRYSRYENLYIRGTDLNMSFNIKEGLWSPADVFLTYFVDKYPYSSLNLKIKIMKENFETIVSDGDNIISNEGVYSYKIRGGIGYFEEYEAYLCENNILRVYAPDYLENSITGVLVFKKVIE